MSLSRARSLSLASQNYRLCGSAYVRCAVCRLTDISYLVIYIYIYIYLSIYLSTVACFAWLLAADSFRPPTRRSPKRTARCLEPPPPHRPETLSSPQKNLSTCGGRFCWKNASSSSSFSLAGFGAISSCIAASASDKTQRMTEGLGQVMAPGRHWQASLLGC